MIGSGDGQTIRDWWHWARMGAAITADTPDGRRFSQLGPASYLAFPQGVLHGWDRIAIGANCVINEHTTLSAGPLTDPPTNPRDATGQLDPIIVLGDRCLLGRHTEIVAMHSVVLEPDVATAAGGVYITDHNHRHDQLDTPILTQEPLDVRPVRVGAGSVLSTGVTVLAGARIGHHTMVAAGAVVLGGDYPPNVVLAGVPARVVAQHPK